MKVVDVSRALGSLIILVSLSACNVALPVPFDETVSVALVVDDACNRSGSSSNAQGTVTWTQRIEGDQCRLSFDWRGQIIDVAELRQAVEADMGIGLDAFSISLNHADANLSELRVVENGREVTDFPEVSAWLLDLDMQGTSFFDANGSSTAELLGLTQSVSLSDAQLDTLSTAINDNAVISGSANGQLSIPVAALSRLAERGEMNLEIHIQGGVEVGIGLSL